MYSCVSFITAFSTLGDARLYNIRDESKQLSFVFHNVLDMPVDTHRIVPDALNTLSHEVERL